MSTTVDSLPGLSTNITMYQLTTYERGYWYCVKCDKEFKFNPSKVVCKNCSKQSELLSDKSKLALLKRGKRWICQHCQTMNILDATHFTCPSCKVIEIEQMKFVKREVEFSYCSTCGKRIAGEGDLCLMCLTLGIECVTSNTCHNCNRIAVIGEDGYCDYCHDKINKD